MLRHDQMPLIPSDPRPLPDGPLYFVGVGGAGMSALAQILAEQGRVVAGADPGIAPPVQARLEAAGVRVHTTHEAAHLRDTAVVVVSDAIPTDNPEVIEAERRGLPIFRRPEVLGAIVNRGRGIAVAGTHGKTTTTGMVASVLLQANLDPTIILGGDLPAIGGNARAGKSNFVLAESCEAYDGFLYLHAEIAVVLNIEADHLDYHGDEAHVIGSFARFLGQVKDGGVKIICADDALAAPFANEGRFAATYAQGRPDGPPMLLAYGVGGEHFARAEAIDTTQTNPSFALVMQGVPFGRVTLQVPGLHNIRNALAAASVGWSLDIAPADIVAGLEAFSGTGRRFERLGEAGGILIVDDYAHHPTELRATLSATRAAYPDRRIVAVFQPHLPSRTRDLLGEFAQELSDGADTIYLTDIYLAREKPLPGITSETLADAVRQIDPTTPVYYVAQKSDLPAALAPALRPGDIVLTLGAGDIREAGENLLALLNKPL